MNDFREYSAAFHAQNDDVMHYGVKGMKWKHHKLPIGGVIGLGRGLIKLGRNKRKESDDKQPDRGRYADSARAAEQAKTVEKNRSDLSNLAKGLESYKKARQNAKAHQEEASRAKFTSAAAKGSAEDKHKQSMAVIQKNNEKRARDRELDKERKRRQRIAANHRKAEQAYRRGGH